MQSTIKPLIDSLRVFRIRTTNGFRMSFWKVKLASSARSKYFIPSCLKESMAYIAIFSSWWLPAEIKWFAKTDHILAQTWKRNQQKILGCNSIIHSSMQHVITSWNGIKDVHIIWMWLLKSCKYADTWRYACLEHSREKIY